MFSLILAIVLIILIILFALVACFLLIPFTVNLSGSISLQNPAKLNFSLSWLGFTLWRTKEKRKVPEAKKEKSPPPTPEKKRGFNLGEGLKMFSIVRESVPAFLHLARYAKKAVHLQNFNADVSFGLGDPSETAMVAGYLWSFVWILNAIPRVSIAFLPQFGETSFGASIRMKARVQMLFLVIGFLRAYMKKPFRRLIKEVRARRRKNQG